MTVGLGLLTALLIFGVVMPEAQRYDFIRSFYESISSNLRLEVWGINGRILIYKIGHVLAFILLSLYLLIFRHKSTVSLACLLCALLLFAISTEVIQLYRYDRDTKITDVFLDLLGVGVGYFIYVSFGYLISRKSKILQNS